MSEALVKLQRKGQVVIPRSLREEVGIAEGTLIKVATLAGGRFLLTPQFTTGGVNGIRVRKNQQAILRELARTVAEIRQEAKEKRLDKMPMREINAAVASARRDLKKIGKRPAR